MSCTTPDKNLKLENIEIDCEGEGDGNVYKDSCIVWNFIIEKNVFWFVDFCFLSLSFP
jgi:hypothetical protein